MRLYFDFEDDGEVDDLVVGRAALMLPHDGVAREHLLEVAGGCLLAPFDDDAIEVLRVLADPTKCRVELSTAAFRGDECPPEVPCAPGCPRCAGRGGFHAARAKLMPAKPPPPPVSRRRLSRRPARELVRTGQYGAGMAPGGAAA